MNGSEGNTVIINDHIRSAQLDGNTVIISYQDNSCCRQGFEGEDIAKEFYTQLQKILSKQGIVMITTGWESKA